MNTKPRVRGIVRTCGVTLIVGVFSLASSLPATAATQWQLTGGRYIWFSTPGAKGACVPSGGWSSVAPGAQIDTILFNNNSGCTDGAGKQCKSTVPTSPASGHLEFDATTCAWTVMVSEPV
ncbi:hypothetical protein JNUCC0626_47840 [Lentzea sp. JNUCC 0626]|uniref:hypothetical protein n=1 Tax=Lentzea sp. JNUCC 0626 TaxID=3367513 RepID=UPI00374A4E72